MYIKRKDLRKGRALYLTEPGLMLGKPCFMRDDPALASVLF